MRIQSRGDALEAGAAAQREIHGTKFIIASGTMQRFMAMVERVAGHTETVLITGETGSGKELIACSIHEFSYRNGKPWIDINCAALPEHLVESELFGYEKGAFSGADNSKPGLFELADKGLCFWMRSANCRPIFRSSCCACWMALHTTVWAGIARSRWMCALSRRRIRTSKPRCERDVSAKIFSIA